MKKRRSFFNVFLALILCIVAPLNAVASSEGNTLPVPSEITKDYVLSSLTEDVFNVTCENDENHLEATFDASFISSDDLTIDNDNIDINEEEKTASVTVFINIEGILKQYDQNIGGEVTHTVDEANKVVSLNFTTNYVEDTKQWSSWMLTTSLPITISASCQSKEPTKTFSVLFMSNLPDVSWEEQIDEVLEGSTVNPTTLPSVEDYELVGWSTDAEATSGVAEYVVKEEDANKDGIIVLYGVWQKITYTLVFDDNGSDIVEPEEMTVSLGEEVDLKGLGKSGNNYRLLGWSLDPEATKYDSTYVVNGDDSDEDNVITLYAVTSYKIPSFSDDDFIYVYPTNTPSNTLSPEVIPTTAPQPTATGTSPLPDPVIPKTGDSLTEEMTYAGIGLGGIVALAALLVFRRKHA